MRKRREQIGDVGVRWFEAERPGAAPVLYLHGVPNSAETWRPLLERTGGIAPDLPGFGRSDKPSGFDYSIPGYARFLRRFADDRGLERFSLVVHDWGAVGLALAQEVPERIERLVIAAAVPLLPGYRWHRIARIWRTPVAGELFMGLSSRWALRQLSREATVAPGPAPDELIDEIWRHFDHGTQRAILKLYRSAPPDVLARAGDRLGAVTAPALVLWGAEDPYLPPEFAARYAEALGGHTRVEVLDGASHWPWIDRPEAIDLTAEFLLE